VCCYGGSRGGRACLFLPQRSGVADPIKSSPCCDDFRKQPCRRPRLFYSPQVSSFGGHFCLLRRDGQLLLDAAGEFVLPFSSNESVFAGHFQIAVAGNPRRFDGAAADRLPPRNVRASERVRSETFKIRSRTATSKMTKELKPAGNSTVTGTSAISKGVISL
jgi:hypothetical protein